VADPFSFPETKIEENSDPFNFNVLQSPIKEEEKKETQN